MLKHTVGLTLFQEPSLEDRSVQKLLGFWVHEGQKLSDAGMTTLTCGLEHALDDGGEARVVHVLQHQS